VPVPVEFERVPSTQIAPTLLDAVDAHVYSAGSLEHDKKNISINRRIGLIDFMGEWVLWNFKSPIFWLQLQCQQVVLK